VLHSITARFCLRSYYSAIWLPFSNLQTWSRDTNWMITVTHCMMGATYFSAPNYLRIICIRKHAVNNIKITWKTIHWSVFCRTNSPSTDQSRAEGNNTECVGKKRFNGRVLPTGFGKSMCYVPPFWTRYYNIFFFLMVICNSLNLLLKSLPINIINCIKSYVNCSALTDAYDWQ
jgi:hypothetical protein